MNLSAACKTVAFLAIPLAALATTLAQTPVTPPPSVTSASYGKLPLSFEANQGQTDPSVQFLSHGQGYTLFLRPGEAVLALRNPKQPAKSIDAEPGQHSAPAQDAPLVSLRLIGANPNASVLHEDEQITRTNYFLGNNPALWRTDIPNYGRVRYRSVYDGIDLVYHGNQRQLEHDFVVAPSVDPSRIVLALDSNRHPKIDSATGDLILTTGSASQSNLHLLKPIAYQESKGRRIPVASSYKLLARNRIGFSVGRYNHSQPLIIDPVLVYSTYLGGSGTGSNGDQGNGIAVDSTGSAYVVGTTYSTNFPVTTGAFQILDKAPKNASTVFVAKLNATGTALVYSTYLGGSGGDSGNAIALDANNEAIVTGTTSSHDFPVTNGAFSTNYASVFVAKLNASGSALVFSTFLGNGTGTAIAADTSGNSYVTGFTSAANFPVTAGAFQTVNKGISAGGTNGFVTKLNPAGTSLVFSTYLGGSGYSSLGQTGDSGRAIAVDSAGNTYVAGATASADFPVTAGAFQTVNAGVASGGMNAFITKLNPSGTAEVYSTFLGGGESSLQYVDAIAIDAAGAAYVAGAARSQNFPTTAGALEPSGYGNFASKLSADGSKLAYSTYLGSYSYPCCASGIAVDASGNAYVSGNSSIAGIFTTPDAAIQLIPGYNSYLSNIAEGYLLKLNPTATAVDYSTLLGDGHGISSATATAVALDSSGNVYVTGGTVATDFPTTSGAFQTQNAGSNAFVSKFSLSGETTGHTPTSIAISASTDIAASGQPLSFTASVTAESGTALPTGQVSFYGIGGASLGVGSCCAYPVGTATLDGTGKATWTTSSLVPDEYHLQANYEGDSTHLSSNTWTAGGGGYLTVIVAGPPNTISVTNPPEPSTQYGGTFAYPLTVQVLDNHDFGVPGVTVNFSGKGLKFLPASAITDSGGQATAIATATAVGSLTATASVSGLSKNAIQSMTVRSAPLTITLKDAWRTYGATNPILNYTVTGLVNGDTVTVTTTAAPASPVGIYPITASVSNAANYTITLQPATLTVTKAPLYISAANVAVTYGQTPPPITKYSISGFVNGDTASVVSGAPVLSTTVTSTTPVGFDPIKVQVGTLAAANYYFSTLSSGEGSVGVYKAPLTIRPSSFTIHVGDPLPTFTYTITGFVNGDTQASATTGAPSLTTTAPSTAKPGRFFIIGNRGTLAAHNYNFANPSPATNGILTILP